MGTDLGDEFSDGIVISDVLLWTTGQIDFQNNIQREKKSDR